MERNPVSKHQIQPEQADAGRDCRSRLARPNFSGANGDREIFIVPVPLTTSRIGNLTRLILSLAIVYVMTRHTYHPLISYATIYEELHRPMQARFMSILQPDPKPKINLTELVIHGGLLPLCLDVPARRLMQVYSSVTAGFCTTLFPMQLHRGTLLIPCRVFILATNPFETTLRFRYWPCTGGLSAVNAIGTQLRDDPINSGLTRWRMAV